MGLGLWGFRGSEGVPVDSELWRQDYCNGYKITPYGRQKGFGVGPYYRAFTCLGS